MKGAAEPNQVSPLVTAWLERWVNLHRMLWLLTLACFFVAWNRGLALLYGVFSLSLALLLISYLMPWLQLRGIRVERALRQDLTAGSDGSIDYRLSTAGRRYHLELHDHLPFAEPQQGLFFSRCDGVAVQRLRIHCARRGCFVLRDLSVTSAYPFGILSRRRALATEPLEVLVLPRVFELSGIPMPVLARGDSEGEVPVPRQGGYGEFAAVREYSHGDELRSIHWRASARQGQLVVKEYERNDRPLLLVVLDCRPAFNQGEGARTTFEYAISIAASMIRFATREGLQSILVADDGHWHERVIPAYSADLYELYELLARLTSNGSRSCAELVEQALTRFPRANLIAGFRLAKERQLPLIPPFLTHIDLEMDSASFRYPLRKGSYKLPVSRGNRLTYAVELQTPLEGLFQ